MLDTQGAAGKKRRFVPIKPVKPDSHQKTTALEASAEAEEEIFSPKERFFLFLREAEAAVENGLPNVSAVRYARMAARAAGGFEAVGYDRAEFKKLARQGILNGARMWFGMAETLSRSEDVKALRCAFAALNLAGVFIRRAGGLERAGTTAGQWQEVARRIQASRRHPEEMADGVYRRRDFLRPNLIAQIRDRRRLELH